jgi:pyruvate formate lyase activating enzyme
MIDFPGKISAIVFTQGCNINCRYCHNPELITPAQGEQSPYGEDDVISYLEKRRGALDGVVITGGEPTIHPDLKDFILKIKKVGYLIKLDTNGTNPKLLREIIEAKLLDFIAMDVKAPFDKYEAICQTPVNIEDIKNSMRAIVASGVPYEFRTTYDKTVLNDEDIVRLKKMIPVNFRVQECLPVKNKPALLVER